MQYTLTPYCDLVEPFVWWDNAFNNDELLFLQNKAKESSIRANVGGGLDAQNLQNIRRSHISWLKNTPETEWIFARLAHVVSSLNVQFYRFDLTGFGEDLQLTNYEDSEKGMYGWHQDSNGRLGISRKLSIVLQLSDPADYEGGNLQILNGSTPINVEKRKGLIAAFPSYTVHQVTPVTSGNRQSLVAWITGPAFR